MIQRVLFVASGNSHIFEVNPIIKRQANSLESLCMKVDIFLVKGKGIRGYLSNIQKLRSHLKNNKYDVVHAHYAFNGLLFLLTGYRLPLVVSFMGSDTYGDYNENGKRILSSYVNIWIAKVIQPFISQIIVKSKNLSNYIYRQSVCHIIPNGVDTTEFKPVKKDELRCKLGLNEKQRIVLFLGDPTNKRKNFTLVRDAVIEINESIKLLSPFPVSPDEISDYYNSADLFVLSSFDEGSPNTVKEAMACNLPIVSTPVGDVEWLLHSVDGTYVSQFDTSDFANCIRNALQFTAEGKIPGGRKRLIDLGLDVNQIALRIKRVYEQALKEYHE